MRPFASYSTLLSTACSKRAETSAPCPALAGEGGLADGGEDSSITSWRCIGGDNVQPGMTGRQPVAWPGRASRAGGTWSAHERPGLRGEGSAMHLHAWALPREIEPERWEP